MSKFMDAWKVSERDFPEKGNAAEKLAFFVRYAILAPSVHNTQPWFFRIDGNACDVLIDRRYALPVIDPDDRALTLACAGSLFALRAAIRRFGYRETVEILPDSANDDWIARVRLGERDVKPLPEETALFEALTARATYRGAFTEAVPAEESLRVLKGAVASEHAWLHVCAPSEKRAVLRLVVEADHIQSADKHFRRELACWTDPRRALSGDGLACLGLSHADVTGRLSPTLARRFQMPDGAVATDDQLERQCPVLAVLGSMKGGPSQRIGAGQAAMRFLLQAQALGLAVTPLAQPCEVPALRLMLHDELEINGRAQMIYRIGYASGKASHSPRRPVSELIETAGGLSGLKKAANDSLRKGLFGGFGLFRKK